MRRKPARFGICRAIGVVVLVSAAAPSAQPAGVGRLGWLQGCWQQVSGDRTVEEQWMAPRGGSLIGMSRTVRGARLVEYEFIVIREDGDALVFDARPSGQAGAAFRSKTMAAASVVFENAEHDFPQRIGYELTAPDTLLAWIEGVRDGGVRRIEFRYGRVSCGSR